MRQFIPRFVAIVMSVFVVVYLIWAVGRTFAPSH